METPGPETPLPEKTPSSEKPGSEKMDVEYEYRREDEGYRSARLLKRLAASGDFIKSKYGILVWVALTALVFAVLRGAVALPGVLLGAAGLVLWGLCRNRWTRERVSADDSSPVFGRKLCRVDGKGIGIESGDMKTWHSWACIRDIEDHGGYISIYYDAIRAVVLPKKSFRNAEELEKFLSLLRKYARASKIGEKPGPVSTSPDALRPRGVVRFAAILLLVAVVYGLNFVVASNALPQTADVTLTVEEASVAGDTVVVLGKISNPGKSAWQVATLQLQFFNAQGKFIDQCTAFSGQRLEAGATDHFKASCGPSKPGDPERGNALLPATLKHFSRVEAKVGSAYKADLFSLFNLF